ncbi:MAG: FG-GAP-like repeat-containing protein [Sporichthyaceae bacterium]|nr:FG-GAP-like repeat-containing protein [Sporichthyaceae bacterium]
MARRTRTAILLVGLPMLLTGTVADRAPAAAAGTSTLSSATPAASPLAAPASALAATGQRRADFDGDGADDFVTIAYGSTDVRSQYPVLVVRYADSTTFEYLETPSPPGPNPTQFGEVLVTGDFNGDGFADIASGDQWATAGTRDSVGSVWVVYGSPAGLDLATLTHLHQDGPGMPGSSEEFDLFGAALAAGGINNDGRDDLAIGAPGEALGSVGRAGMVYLLRGSASGLTTTGLQTFHKNSPGISGSPVEFDFWGHAVAIGDVTGNGRDDLAIGIPGHGIDGAIVLLPGGSSGASVASMDWVTHPPDNLPNTTYMGWSLAIADTTGDGKAEVLSSDPYNYTIPNSGPGSGAVPVAGAGAVICIPGRSTGISTTGMRVIHQNTSGVPETAEDNEYLGARIVAGDITGDGKADLVATVANESVGSVKQAGALMLFKGSASSCLTTTGSQLLHQHSTGVPGDAETDNWFGHGLGLMHLNGDNRLDIVTAASNDTIGTGPAPPLGRVITITGTTSGFGTVTHLLTAATLPLPGFEVWIVGRGFVAPASHDPFGL